MTPDIDAWSSARAVFSPRSTPAEIGAHGPVVPSAPFAACSSRSLQRVRAPVLAQVVICLGACARGDRRRSLVARVVVQKASEWGDQMWWFRQVDLPDAFGPMPPHLEGVGTEVRSRSSAGIHDGSLVPYWMGVVGHGTDPQRRQRGFAREAGVVERVARRSLGPSPSGKTADMVLVSTSLPMWWIQTHPVMGNMAGWTELLACLRRRYPSAG